MLVLLVRISCLSGGGSLACTRWINGWMDGWIDTLHTEAFPPLPLCALTPVDMSLCVSVPVCLPRHAAHAHSPISQTPRIAGVQLSTSAAARPPCNGKKPPAQRSAKCVLRRVCERKTPNRTSAQISSREAHRKAAHAARSSQKAKQADISLSLSLSLSV